jgi:hypothetical protein
MSIAQYVTGQGTVYNASRLEGDNLGTVQAHNVDAANITTGTFSLARIPTMDDARIPDLEALSYGAAFATAQVPPIGAYKTASGTFSSDRIPILPTDRYGSAVLLTGAQSIGGTKTFTDIPILPASDPTADNEAARKAYVDAQSGVKFHPYIGDETQLETVSATYQELKNFRFVKHGSVVSPGTIRMACELKTTAGSYQVQVIVGGATAMTFSGKHTAYTLRYADYGLGAVAAGVVELRSKMRNIGAGTAFNRLFDAYLKY